MGNITSKDDVSSFLSSFHVKIRCFPIIFRDDRGKNAQTLLNLEINPNRRKEIIEELCIEDFSEGPIVDTLNRFGDMWVFGKSVKGQEIYIKISMGVPNSSAICISFHISERPMSYPYK
jgi:hypothetical protein